LTALFVVALVAGFAQFGAVASLDDVARHFGHHTSSQSLQSVVGLSGSVLGLGLAVLRLASLGALPLASLADRWGRTSVLRRTLLVGLVITACASLSPSYWFFVLCFALARPLLSTTSALIQVITVELSRTSQRIHRLVIISAGAGIGAGLAAILHGVIRGPDSFRWLFALALLPVFFLRPILRRVPEPTFHDDPAPLARLGAVPLGLRGRVVIVGTIVFIIGVISGPASGFTFVYGEGILKISPPVVASVVALSAVTGLAGLLLSRYLAGVVGRRWTVVLGTLATAATASLAYGGGKTAFVIGYMSGVAAGGLLAPAIAALSTELFAHSFRATAAGWIVVAGVLGAMAGLLLFGWIGDSVHVTGAGSLRIPALVTFLPLLPLLLLLRRLPESSKMELT
jgi:MFS family permease